MELLRRGYCTHVPNPHTTPLPFLSSYNWTNNKMNVRPDSQEKKTFKMWAWEIIDDGLRNDRLVLFLYFLNKQ